MIRPLPQAALSRATRDDLGSEGLLRDLARHLPTYEVRPGQATMAAAVDRALREDGILLCEAGTGTGKTFAYLAPAILSGKKVVISTATRALQEQVFVKDLPIIEEMLGVRTRAVMMKGLGNYLCRRRFAEFQSSVEGLRPKYAERVRAIESWIDETESGDIAELARFAEDDPIWPEITSSSDTRVGPRCAHFQRCFVTQMRQAAEAAQIIVVNHHLFFADLVLRGPHPAKVLPNYEAVIFDEAHQLEDIATQFFGVRISRARIERLLHDSESGLRLLGQLDPLLGGVQAHTLLEELRAANVDFWQALLEQAPSREGRLTLHTDSWAGKLSGAWHRLDSRLEALAALASQLGDRLEGANGSSSSQEVLEQIQRRSDIVRTQLSTIVEGQRGRVSWLDVSPRSVSLSASPIDVAPVLRERIFSSISSVVLTSATLSSVPQAPRREATDAGAIAGPFGYIRERLGLTPDLEVSELDVPSPFSFQEQAILYTPDDLPPPDAFDFLRAAAARSLELIEITNGGAFVLTTSLRAMRELHAALKGRLGPRRLYLQGEAPKSALIRSFRASPDAVLVATQSFWEGVDVPGDALRLVILEKVPFASPGDPVLKARSEILEAQGKNPFMTLHVPAAAITLKQGFGRLIRRRTDRGVVALLDPRVHRRGYGKRLLAVLPPAERTLTLERVREFWHASKPSSVP